MGETKARVKKCVSGRTGSDELHVREEQGVGIVCQGRNKGIKNFSQKNREWKRICAARKNEGVGIMLQEKQGRTREWELCVTGKNRGWHLKQW